MQLATAQNDDRGLFAWDAEKIGRSRRVIQGPRILFSRRAVRKGVDALLRRRVESIARSA